MKNNNHTSAESNRKATTSKALQVDASMNRETAIRVNQSGAVTQPRRKRNINYTKKILNDPFIFTV